MGITEQGRRCGEDHPGAKLTDAQVDEIRELHEDGLVGYKWLAKHFGVPVRTIREIIQCRRRWQVAMRYKRVRVKS